jgi:hypothetical protein
MVVLSAGGDLKLSYCAWCRASCVQLFKHAMPFGMIGQVEERHNCGHVNRCM